MNFSFINLLTFRSRCGDKFSNTELKLCIDGELPFFSLTIRFGVFRLFSKSLGGVILGDEPILCLVGEFSLLFVNVVVKLKPSPLFIGDIVRSGDNVIRCVIGFNGDVGESKLIDRALVSAIKRRACSRKRA